MSRAEAHIHFPGLNGVRFFAAFLVIIHHIEQLKMHFKLGNYFHQSNFVSSAGGAGVTLFFVLSGFLITYLLLAEKDNFGNVSVKMFYVRRILRIWPLYFLIVISGFFLLPWISFLNIPEFSSQIHSNFGLKVFLFSIFLPHLSVIIFPIIPFIDQTWSIGVEEQFYLMWPWIIKCTKKYFTAFILLLLIFILGLYALPSVLMGFDSIKANNTAMAYVSLLNSYLSILRISCMAIGGIGAYLLFFKKEYLLKILYRKNVQIIIIFVTLFCLIKGVNLKYLNAEFYSVLFCILILNIASNPDSIIKMENKPLHFLGKISYGLYMYHQIAIVAVIMLLIKISNTHFAGFMPNVFLYSLSIILTIGLSAVSYFHFEEKFLNLKKRFTRVISK